MILEPHNMTAERALIGRLDVYREIASLRSQ